VNTLSYKTVSVNKENADKKWLIVDAEGQQLGRMSSKVAKLIKGKHKTCYTPHADCGDNIIVINAEKVQLSGSKWVTKEYIRHTGYPGGQKSLTAEELFQRSPSRIIEKAVKGMLPKNNLGRAIFKNLRVVEGAEHKFEAQKPKAFDLNSFK
jgi:large subunit ribosomal protein L13